jgi:predicted RNA-binding Zn-ribbon protein involved in translation (DUF1610 family)
MTRKSGFSVTYECPKCGKESKTIEQHDKHVREVHGSEK